jgi:hypothetical protein
MCTLFETGASESGLRLLLGQNSRSCVVVKSLRQFSGLVLGNVSRLEVEKHLSKCTFVASEMPCIFVFVVMGTIGAE